MDKARFPGRSALEYFGLSSSQGISIDDAANKLVKELTGEDSVPSESSYAAYAEFPASVSKAALDALLSIHGEQDAGFGQKNVPQMIKDARKKYLKQAKPGDKASLSAEFETKVINLLVQRLSGRTRLFYCGKSQELSRALQNGSFTKYMYDQEMLYFMREVMNSEDYYLETEVVNALSLIGNEKENVVDGLVYLFKGKIDGDLMGRMQEFENVLTEILNNKKFGDPENEKKRDYRRNFIEKARENLANRLPEPDRNEYFKFEKKQRENLSQRSIDYDSYRDSVLDWLIERPLQKGLEKALNGRSATECCEILVNLIKENWVYNNHQHLFQGSSLPEGKRQDPYQVFLAAAFAYVDSKSSITKTKTEKYAEFVMAAKGRLLQALPESISKAHERHVKIIDELLKNGCIDLPGYKESENAYLLGIIHPGKDDRQPVRRAINNAPDKSGLNTHHLEKIVSNALQKSIRTNNRKNDTLEALIMCWGGFVNTHHNNFSLQPVLEAKSAYLKTKDSTHANDEITKFRVDGEFSVEARKQLVKQLPGNLRQSYDAHEKLLLDHLEKGHITQKAYWNGMVLFLDKHFRLPS